MKLKKYIAGGLGIALVPLFTWTMQAQIVGSKHDFTSSGWNSSGQICIVCHTPHNSKSNNTSGSLLWNRQMTSAVFTIYKSPTTKATLDQPDGASRLCLSCHDGTIALENFGSKTDGTSMMTGDAKIGTNLSDDHPISFVYDSTLAHGKKTLKDPSVDVSGMGGTIDQDMLRDHKLQCVSCHDVHNAYGQPSLLIKSNAGSALCLTCHKI